jgi:hypothetical protein
MVAGALWFPWRPVVYVSLNTQRNIVSDDSIFPGCIIHCGSSQGFIMCKSAPSPAEISDWPMPGERGSSLQAQFTLLFIWSPYIFLNIF